MRYRTFSTEFKKKIIEDIRSGLISMAQTLRQHNLHESVVYRWMERYDRGKYDIQCASSQSVLENQIAELERKVGQQAMEIELLKKARDHYQQKLKDKSLNYTPKVTSKRSAE